MKNLIKSSLIESERKGYNEVSKLVVNNPKFKKDEPGSDLNPEKIETNNQNLIRKTAKAHFQTIYTDQKEVQGSILEIEEFLIMANDTVPWVELDKIDKQLADKS